VADQEYHIELSYPCEYFLSGCLYFVIRSIIKREHSSHTGKVIQYVMLVLLLYAMAMAVYRAYYTVYLG